MTETVRTHAFTGLRPAARHAVAADELTTAASGIGNDKLGVGQGIQIASVDNSLCL